VWSRDRGLSAPALATPARGLGNVETRWVIVAGLGRSPDPDGGPVSSSVSHGIGPDVSEIVRSRMICGITCGADSPPVPWCVWVLRRRSMIGRADRFRASF
jgi:hypothetical protein